MKNWKTTIIANSASIRQAVETIDNSEFQIAVVTDEEHHLLGIVTDGDVRKGILKGISLQLGAITPEKRRVPPKSGQIMSKLI